MRQWINLVEHADSLDNTKESIDQNKNLMEAAGTYGFFKPDGKIDLEINGQCDHAIYVAHHPEEFDLPPETRMLGSADILNKIFEKGWVRINSFRGRWYFQGSTIKLVRKAVEFYDYAYEGLSEVVIEFGPDSANPERSYTLMGDNIKNFVKFGKLPSYLI